MAKKKLNATEWHNICTDIVKCDINSNRAFYKMVSQLGGLEKAIGRFYTTKLNNKVREEALYALRYVAVPDWLAWNPEPVKKYNNFEIFACLVIRRHLATKLKERTPTPIPVEDFLYRYDI